ncbi:uncharacterized protein LOC128986039 [Macrosteles quadrilineatus]|uniref:uncharacterized protein LOC128986039 n=1 Tax=Macrosteles quadrilineatus TaxID=74068 RepID=UPI0023E224C8|nr:uncharacterized protein LOC128986039 [Macrosteles quadrilineatus]XP_054262102.1 uncharacterized protein LOC128986039 [Macrosteles quadrilineatus]
MGQHESKTSSKVKNRERSGYPSTSERIQYSSRVDNASDSLRCREDRTTHNATQVQNSEFLISKESIIPSKVGESLQDLETCTSDSSNQSQGIKFDNVPHQISTGLQGVNQYLNTETQASTSKLEKEQCEKQSSKPTTLQQRRHEDRDLQVVFFPNQPKLEKGLKPNVESVDTFKRELTTSCYPLLPSHIIDVSAKDCDKMDTNDQFQVIIPPKSDKLMQNLFMSSDDSDKSNLADNWSSIIKEVKLNDSAIDISTSLPDEQPKANYLDFNLKPDLKKGNVLVSAKDCVEMDTNDHFQVIIPPKSDKLKQNLTMSSNRSDDWGKSNLADNWSSTIKEVKLNDNAIHSSTSLLDEQPIVNYVDFNLKPDLKKGIVLVSAKDCDKKDTNDQFQVIIPPKSDKLMQNLLMSSNRSDDSDKTNLAASIIKEVKLNDSAIEISTSLPDEQPKVNYLDFNLKPDLKIGNVLVSAKGCVEMDTNDHFQVIIPPKSDKLKQNLTMSSNRSDDCGKSNLADNWSSTIKEVKLNDSAIHNSTSLLDEQPIVNYVDFNLKPDLKKGNVLVSAKDCDEMDTNGQFQVIIPPKSDKLMQNLTISSNRSDHSDKSNLADNWSSTIKEVKSNDSAIHNSTSLPDEQPIVNYLDFNLKPDLKKGNVLVDDDQYNYPSWTRNKVSIQKDSTDETLKHVEMLAESLTGLSDRSKSRQDYVRLKSNNSGGKEKHNPLMLRDCIAKMRNVQADDTKFVFSLQSEIKTILREMEQFTSALKICPVVNSEIHSASEIIRENLYVLKTNYEEKCSRGINSNVESSKEEHFSNKESQAQNHYYLGEKPMNYYPWINHGENRSEVSNNDAVIVSEVSNNPVKIMEGSNELIKVSGDVLNGPEVVNSSFTKEYLQNVLPEPSLNINSLPNYKGVLELVKNSVEGGLKFEIDVYVCVLCDFLENDKNNAQKHICTEAKPNSTWHFCRFCVINIFGTDSHFKEHCMTTYHINIKKLKGECSAEERKEKSIRDDESVSSEKSTRSRTKMTTHEILLSIAKQKKERKIPGPFGLYCQICKKYDLESKALTNHLESKLHKDSFALRIPSKKNVDFGLKSCTTCEVHLFGDQHVWTEHQSLDLHKEFVSSPFMKKLDYQCSEKTCNSNDVSESTTPDPEDSESTHSLSSDVCQSNDPQQISLTDQCGIHHDFMKTVLKKHVSNKSDNILCGIFCQFCKLYFQNESQGKLHSKSSCHLSKINSFEVSGKSYQHHCKNCNIDLFCDEQFFSSHLESLGHKAISKLHITREEYEEVESECGSDEEANTSESEHENVNLDTPSQKHVKLQERKTKKEKIVRNGIYLSGLPQDFPKKHIMNYFKNYGHVRSCSYIKQHGNVIFQNPESVKTVLQEKHFIKGIRVEVKPLKAVSPKSIEQEQLHPDVTNVLRSMYSLEATISEILTEMQRNYVENQQKSIMIRSDLSASLPGCRVLFFGSQVTGLATSKSDFDLYIDYDGKSFYHDLSYEKQCDIMHHLAYQLNLRGSKFEVTEAIQDARVPIIRVLHLKTHTKCDISFRNGLAVENSQLIKLYLDMDPRVRWLVVTIKLWMEMNGLLNPRKFTSYSTIWLVLFYLMRLPRHPLVCPVTTLQEKCKPHYVAKWDCRFHRDMRDVSVYFKTYCQESNLELLANFFKTYAYFPFRNTVMCPLNGKTLSRQQFKDLRDLPKEFNPYVDKARRFQEWEKLKILTPVCLQDPFDLSHNITKGVHRTDLDKFQSLCHKTYLICQNLLAK